VFFQNVNIEPNGWEEPAGRCGIHLKLGHAALPAACQHFPRQCLIDRRGVFITLSHYCPTAAELLFTSGGPAEIVHGPPATPAGDAEGLDARDVLPPLLTANVLMDLAGYAAWEAHMVRTLAGCDALRSRRSPDQSMDLLEEHARTLGRWRPGGPSLAEAVDALPSDRLRPEVERVDWERDRRLFDRVRAALGPAQSWPEIPRDVEDGWDRRVAPGWVNHHAVIGRFLGAHAFASWMAYQGNGVLSLVNRLRAALAILRVEAVRACLRKDQPLSGSLLKHSLRQTDLLLVHLVDRDALAARLATSAV
jgi:hypothetical protein